jgi:hypothetical protein
MRVCVSLSGAAVRLEPRDDSVAQIDAAGRPVRQIELCTRHAQVVVARERARGFEIFDRRDWR